jgi:hypothetical protein
MPAANGREVSIAKAASRDGRAKPIPFRRRHRSIGDEVRVRRTMSMPKICECFAAILLVLSPSVPVPASVFGNLAANGCAQLILVIPVIPVC